MIPRNSRFTIASIASSTAEALPIMKNKCKNIRNIAVFAVYPHARPISDRYLRPHDLRLSCNEIKVTVGRSISSSTVSYRNPTHRYSSVVVCTREKARTRPTAIPVNVNYGLMNERSEEAYRNRTIVNVI